jgi:hypothetical protein
MGSLVERRRAVTSLAALGALASGACVDAFRGSNVQIELSPATPVQVSPGRVPGPGQLPADGHFTLYAIQEGADRQHLFALQRFEVHMIVAVSSPCFIDVGEHVPHEGLHVSQYAAKIAEDTGIADYQNPPPGASEQDKIDAATAAQRMINIAALGGSSGIKVVTSASASTYPPVAADCDGPADQIPPPACTDDASNRRRLALCQQAWRDDPALWEGTDRVLTAPLAGTTYGMVDGMNPVNLAPVGGAQFFVPEDLTDIDAYALYWQLDGTDGPGTLLLHGTPTSPTRGVARVHMESPTSPLFTADLAIFADIGEDDVHF